MFVCKRKMVVDAKPAFIELFRKSNMKARNKGKFHTLVSGFRRRRYEEIEKSEHEEKYEELKRIKEKNDKTIQELNNKLDEYQQMDIENNENISKLSKLYELGIVNEEGEYTGKVDNDRD